MAIQAVKDQLNGGFEVVLVSGTTLQVPNDPNNRHFQEVQDWIADGNTPDPADPLPQPLTTRQKIIDRLRSDPILKAQVIDSFEARGITDKQQMLAALEAKFADVI